MDGTTALVRRDMIQKYCEIAQKIAKEFKVEWEFTINKKMVFSNTNAYISVIEEKFMLDDDCNFINHKKGLSEVKRKGALFRYGDDVPLGDSVNELIVPKALEAYFVHGIEPEDYISNWKENGCTIFDFCVSKKVNKQFEVYHGDTKVQNINRYYFSRRGEYLIKQGKEYPHSRSHLHVGNPVKLLNIYDPNTPLDEYEINFNYYIYRVKKLITQITISEWQPSLFD